VTASVARHARTGRVRGFNAVRPRELVLRYALLLVVLAITVGPFLWELSTSVKAASEDVYPPTPQLLPQHPTLAHYGEVVGAVPVFSYVLNSLVVAVLAVGGNVLGATLAGFALARLRFRGAKLVLGLFLATLVLPGEVTIVSQFVIVKDLGFADTLFGVALPGMIAALNVLLMYNAFRSVPAELDQAAVIDGATVWHRLRHVAVPSATGTIAVVAIFAFIGAWDDFLWPLIVLTDQRKYTLTVGLQYLSGTFSTNPRLIAAGTMIAFLPIALVFAALQRYFFRGVGEGAVKG
jgi:multiple sugar transport system permease protein